MEINKIQLDDQNPNVTLTTYLLNDSPELLDGKPRPAILICPGGGYFSCSDREAEPIALEFAAKGYHAFVLHYTTYNDGEMGLPDLSGSLPIKQDRTYPKQLRDLGQAMLKIKEQATNWKVDPDQIILCGFSAGGHNVALYATNWNKPLLVDYFQVDPKQLQPRAVILGYALTDYVFLEADLAAKNNPMDVSFMHASNTAFLGTEKPTQVQLEAVSPTQQVDAQTPPMFIWCTATDPLVSPQHSLKMATALAEKNIPFELHIFSDGPHGLSLATAATSQAKTQIYPEVATWTTSCQAWLEKFLALPLEELTDFEKFVKEQKQ